MKWGWHLSVLVTVLCLHISYAPPSALADDATGKSKAVADVLTQPSFQGLNAMPGVPQYLGTPLGRLHFWTLGDDRAPPVVLLHQGPWFSIQFAKAMPLLVQQGFRVIAVDIPGFGLSQRPDHAVTGAEYAEGLVVLLDHLKIKKTSVVGILTGATVSLAFASTQPERTACAVLQSMPVYSEAELNQRLNAESPDTRIYQDGRHVSAWWKNIQQRRALNDTSPESLQWLMIGTMLAGDGLYAGEASKTFVTRTFDAARAIEKVKAPTLLVSVGAETSENWARRAMKVRPDFDHQALPKGGALIPYDRAAEWASAIGGFLSKNCR